jgi:ribonuclease D
MYDGSPHPFNVAAGTAMFVLVNAALVSDPASLEALAARMLDAARIAFDTESASFHRYTDRVYLIQVSSDRETALVDPLALPDLSPLGALLADERIEIVFHDADYDLRVLDRDYGFRARRVFDTRIAAQLLGEPAIGLAALLEKYLGVTLDKKLQRADWSIRPLTPAMIAYAAADTMHLLGLRDLLAARLEAAGRGTWAQEEFTQLEDLRWTAPTSEDGYLRIKGAGLLSRRSQAVLRAVHQWREQVAQGLDRSPFRVMPNEALLALARSVPQSPEQMHAVRGLPTSLANRYGNQLLAAIQKGLATPLDTLAIPERRPRQRPDAAQEARFERLKLLRNHRAQELGLEPGVMCPNGALQAIARAAPTRPEDLMDIVELKRWQVEAVGTAAILGAAADPTVQ